MKDLKRYFSKNPIIGWAAVAGLAYIAYTKGWLSSAIVWIKSKFGMA